MDHRWIDTQYMGESPFTGRVVLRLVCSCGNKEPVEVDWPEKVNADSLERLRLHRVPCSRESELEGRECLALRECL